MRVRHADRLLEAGHMVMEDGSRFGVFGGPAGITLLYGEMTSVKVCSPALGEEVLCKRSGPERGHR